MSQDPEVAARRVREALGIGSITPVPDLLYGAENTLGYRVFVLNLPADSEPETSSLGSAPGVDGLYQLNRNEPFVMVNSAGRGDVKMRFTLAHEMGHHELGHGATVDARISFGTRDPIEIAANKFAAELLVPRSGIDDWLARNGDPDVSLEVVVKLAYHFNVSAQTSLYRLENSNRVKPTRSSQLKGDIDKKLHYDLASSLGLTRPHDTLNGLKGGGEYVPAVMRTRVRLLLKEGLISREAAKARLRLFGDDAESQLEELVGTDSPGDTGEA